MYFYIMHKKIFVLAKKTCVMLPNIHNFITVILLNAKVFKAEYMFSDWILDCQSDEECKSNITALR